MNRPSPSTVLASTWRQPGGVAIRAAWANRRAGGSLLDALEAGLTAAEIDPALVAIGLGSVPNADGELELDASIMEGRHLEAGAVCAVRGIVPVIRVARAVMEQTPHVMLAGDAARRFALEIGLTPRNLMTDDAVRRWEAWAAAPERVARYVHHVDDPSTRVNGEPIHDTVTMLGFETTPEGPHVVAASSTSGLPFKRPGRVGDSPIVGAGIYADDEAGAAGATGNGEELWKAVAAFRAVEGLRAGLSPTAACEAVVRHMIRRQAHATDLPCVVMAMGRDGEVGAATTSESFPFWICRNGELEEREVAAVRE